MRSIPSQHVFSAIYLTLRIQGYFFKARVQYLSSRSSPRSCCMKATKWWFIITSFFKCGLPILKIYWRSIFNFYLKIFVVALSWRHHGSWRSRWKKKIFLRLQNESKWSYYEIWPFNCPHTSRFRCDMGVRYGLTLVIGALKVMASTCAFVRVVCALKHSTGSFSTTPSTILT